MISNYSYCALLLRLGRVLGIFPGIVLRIYLDTVIYNFLETISGTIIYISSGHSYMHMYRLVSRNNCRNISKFRYGTVLRIYTGTVLSSVLG